MLNANVAMPINSSDKNIPENNLFDISPLSSKQNSQSKQITLLEPSSSARFNNTNENHLL
jgi:hypothetical protein